MTPHNLIVVLRFHQSSAPSPEQTTHEKYQVTVLQAPGQGWGGPMITTSFEERQIHFLRDQYSQYITRQLESGRSTIPETEIHVLRHIGNGLFDLLPETVQRRLYQARQVALAQGCNLEIRLVFEKSAYTLLTLPWELLHFTENKLFLGLSGGGITRQLLLPTAATPTPEARPRQILGVWAEPAGLQPLTDRQTWGTSPTNPGQIFWLQGANTLEQLKNALDEGEFDALHIVAHGRSGDRWNFGLALVNAQGEPLWLGGDELATLLSSYPQIRFVYLDVCAAGDNSSTTGDEQYLVPGGIAPYVLGAGVAAVVVMKAEVGQAAAGVMASTFYQALAQGQNIPTALTTARRLVRLQLGDYLHWSIPALYTQHFKELSSPSQRLADAVITLKFVEPLYGFGLPLLIIMALIAQLAHRLTAAHGQLLPTTSLLLESNLIILFAALLTTHWHPPLQKKYNLHGKAWFPVLLHKYFSAYVWVLMGEFVMWVIWLILVWSGLDSPANLYYFWVVSLSGLAFLAHIGAIYAIKQQMIFLRVHFSLFKSNVWDTTLMIVMSLLIPLIPFLAGAFFAHGLFFIPEKHFSLVASLLLLFGGLATLYIYQATQND